jgi:hypothetical protein
MIVVFLLLQPIVDHHYPCDLHDFLVLVIIMVFLLLQLTITCHYLFDLYDLVVLVVIALVFRG